MGALQSRSGADGAPPAEGPDGAEALDGAGARQRRRGRRRAGAGAPSSSSLEFIMVSPNGESTAFTTGTRFGSFGAFRLDELPLPPKSTRPALRRCSARFFSATSFFFFSAAAALFSGAAGACTGAWLQRTKASRAATAGEQAR